MNAVVRRCPVCVAELENLTYEGFPVMRCPGCGGYLLREARLKGIQRRRQYPAEAFQRAIDASPGVDTDSVLRCPLCRRAMRKERTRFGVHFQVDMCSGCGAVWLDAGELERLQMHFEQSPFGQDSRRLQETWETMSPERREEFERNRARLPEFNAWDVEVGEERCVLRRLDLFGYLIDQLLRG